MKKKGLARLAVVVVALAAVAGAGARGADTSLTGDGPDADAVLELVRTYA